jgi:phosphoribosylglycinamide formyltransferase 1
MPLNTAVLLSGRGSNMAALLAAQDAACPYRIRLVLSPKPSAPGLALAAAQGIATWSHAAKGMERAAFDHLLDQQLRAHQIELIALAGYMRLLSAEFVTAWAGRIVNIHPSLLPLYKGLDTHARALAAGDHEAGCSVHIVTPELDDGPLLGQARVPVLPGDSAEQLAARVLAAEHELYPATLKNYAAKLLAA